MWFQKWSPRFHLKGACGGQESGYCWDAVLLEISTRPLDFVVGLAYLRQLGWRSFTFMHWRRKWQPIPVFLPGESQGQRSLVGCRLWGHTESDTTEATWQQQQQQGYVLSPGGLRGGVPLAKWEHSWWEIFCECHTRCSEADRTMAFALLGKTSEKGQAASPESDETCLSGSSLWGSSLA